MTDHVLFSPNFQTFAARPFHERKREYVYTLPGPLVDLNLPEKRKLALQSDPAPGGALPPGIVLQNLQAYQRTAALKAAMSARTAPS